MIIFRDLWVISRKLFFFVCLFSLLSCSKKVELKLLIWEGFAPSEVLEIFQKEMKKKHGVDVSFRVKFPYDEDDFLNYLKEDKADLVSISHYMFQDPIYLLIKENRLLELDLARIPNYKNIFPPFKEFKFLREENRVYGVPLENSSYGLFYNSKKLSLKPESWSILWDQRFKGKYSISEYYFETNFYITALASGIPLDKVFDTNYVVSNPLFMKNLTYLAQNARTYFDDLEEPSDIKGSILSTGFGNFIHKLSPDEEWRFANPTEGVPGSMDFWAVNAKVSSSKLKLKIIYDWINFTLSDYYQREVLIETNGEMPVIWKFDRPLTEYQKNRFKFHDQNYYNKDRFLWPARSRENLELMRSTWKKALGNRGKGTK